MKYQATAKYIRISTRKVRLVADSIRTMNPPNALTALSGTVKTGSKAMASVIQSAIAGAKQKGAREQDLSFESIEVMEGPTMKRWRAVSRGMGHGYKKRMTHIRIVLTDSNKKEQSKEQKAEKVTAKQVEKVQKKEKQPTMKRTIKEQS